MPAPDRNQRECRRVRISAAALAASAVLALGVTLSLGGAALAHHSFAMFDNDHQIKLVGTVTDFKWQNPHTYIEMESMVQCLTTPLSSIDSISM